MKSKRSLVNKTLLITNLKRYWPLMALFSIFNAFEVLLMSLSMRDFSMIERKENGISFLAEAVSTAVPVESFIYAAFVALAVWGYLYQPRQIRFMHSLPSNRTTLFVTQYLSGLIMMAVPFAVGVLLYIVSSVVNGCFDLLVIIESVGIVCMIIVIFFSFASFWAMLTMNRFVYFAAYLFFSFLGPILELTYYLLAELFCLGVYNWECSHLNFTSPVVQILNQFEFALTKTDSARYIKYVGVNHVFNYFVVGVILTLAAYWMYKAVKSEHAGNIASFALLQKILLYIVTILGTIFLSVLLYEFLSLDAMYVNPYWYFFCVVISCFISYFGMSMIMKKTVRIFDKKTWIHAATLLGMFALGIVALWFDVFHICNFHPQTSDIKEIEFWVETNNYYMETGVNDEEIELLLDFLDSVADRREELLNTKLDNGQYTTYVCACFTLDDGSVERKGYRFIINSENRYVEGTLENDIHKLLSNPKMISNRLRLNSNRYELLNAVIAKDIESWYLSTDETAGLLDAMILDAQEGNWCGYEGIFSDNWYGDNEYIIDVELIYDDAINEYSFGEQFSLQDTMLNTIQFLLSTQWVDEDDLIYCSDYYMSEDYIYYK